jgi:hypothetical protein
VDENRVAERKKWSSDERKKGKHEDNRVRQISRRVLFWSDAGHDREHYVLEVEEGQTTAPALQTRFRLPPPRITHPDDWLPVSPGHLLKSRMRYVASPLMW